MDITLRGFLPHDICTPLGCIFYISTGRTSQAIWQTRFLLCDKSVKGSVSCFGIADISLLGREGKGKSVACCILPLPSKKHMEKLFMFQAMERQTCTKTRRWHAITQVCLLQLPSENDVCSSQIGIRLAQSDTVWNVSFSGEHRQSRWLTVWTLRMVQTWHELTNINQTKPLILPKFGSQIIFKCQLWIFLLFCLQSHVFRIERKNKSLIQSTEQS